MKRIGLIAVIILIMTCIIPTTAVVAVANGSVPYVLHNGVNLYADTTFNDVVEELDANVEVEILDEVIIGGETYYKVFVNDKTGYILAKYVYYTEKNGTYVIFTAKAYGDRVGGHVNVYVLPNTDAEIKCTLLDGTEMTVAKSEYEGYYEVVLEDGVGYVKEENVTTSISYNERVALIIGIVACVTVILILLITYFRRNADYLKRKRK